MVVLMFSCSVSSNLSRKYVGEGIEVLYRDMGSPKTIENLKNGNKLFGYVKETFVRETEISTGRGTLDKKMSPAYSKVEFFDFEIDKNGL
ncbi:MAG TPA: hypothetical protein PLB87_10005, partial [Prolixibacteraceae bacterium]|nr:hypothetical protein [Prolixibacteraceae bacterium]